MTEDPVGAFSEVILEQPWSFVPVLSVWLLHFIDKVELLRQRPPGQKARNIYCLAFAERCHKRLF